MQALRHRLTYANVMSSLAIFLVLGGATAFAASQLGRNSVGTKQLRAGSVTAAKLKRDAVTGVTIKDGAVGSAEIEAGSVDTAKIRDGAVTGAKVATSTLGTVPNAAHATNAANAATAANAASAATFAGYSREGVVRLQAAPEGPDFAATVAAAPPQTLFSSGPFTVYAKCVTFVDTFALVFIQTSENGSIVISQFDELRGEPFLNVDTAELDRELAEEETGLDSADLDSQQFTAMSPSGTALRGDVHFALKNGDLEGGNGIYGPGNVCLFSGEATALDR